MFGATQKKPTRATGIDNSSKKATNTPAGPPKLDFFAELKLKAQKRAPDASKPEEIPAAGGGMGGFLGELQNAAKKKQARRGSVV
jgi:hypothetical protein